MKKLLELNIIMLIVGLVLTGLFFFACAGDKAAAPLVSQALDYTVTEDES